MSSTPTSRPPSGRHRKPCRLYAQGHCRFGDRCKFGHDPAVQPVSDATQSDSQQRNPPSRDDATTNTDQVSRPGHEISEVRPRPKRGEIPCRAWKAGTCAKGAKCWFGHDVDHVQKPGSEPLRSHKQKSSRSVQEGGGPSTAAAAAAALTRAELERREAERKVTDALNAREEANKTMAQVVNGSIVTFSAGLDVSSLVAGFETCTLRVGNLSPHINEDDIQALLIDQGLHVGHFYCMIKKKPDRRPEAHIVTDVTSGKMLASSLDGTDFQEETLVVEMSATNSFEGMSAAAGQSCDILTISWRAPSVRYVVECDNNATASAKVGELDRTVFKDRRLKVEMNTRNRGRNFVIANMPITSIKISNLPPTVTDEDIRTLTGFDSVKRLHNGSFYGMPDSTEHMAWSIRGDIQLAVPGGLRKFDNPPKTCTIDGIISARAHFSSWDDAHVAYTVLSGKRFVDQPIWLRLPDPMYFTLIIPVEQYKAQKAQWISLLNSIKDRKACTLNVRELGNAVCIRLSGSVKEATGAMKVRVENLARGEKVEGWHRSFSNSGNPFVHRVGSETGAYFRADWKRQSLKVYGAPGAVDQAREMIKTELERLASLDYTTTIAWHSVGFFVREGLQQLKDTLGEENVRFVMASRKITVSGGEDARHALDRLLTLSHKGSSLVLPEGTQTCPVCYDTVSSPHPLACGHTYCVACLRHFISSALESDQLPLTCLGDEARCRVPIAIPTIQHFLPPTSFNRLLETAFDTYIAKHPEEFRPCKTPDCTQIYRAARAGVAPQTLHCPSCFSAVCNACHEEAHDGVSCVECRIQRDPAEQERLNDAWIASQGGRVKRCPQCTVPIEKLEGCNHMTCRCGAHVCWRCMGIFTAQTIYQHMHTAHGTIHDDAPAIVQPVAYVGPPVDIEEQRELFRQVERRRANAVREGDDDGWMVRPPDPYRVAQRRVLEQRLDEERRRREEQQRQRRETEEQQRYMRQLREQAMWEVTPPARESGGWGCTIM